MDGILLVDKPAGWTSFDVVAKVRAIIKAGTGQRIKIGHTGTLDPLATGLLVLVVGSYTKRAGEFSKLDKIYEAELTLGATSTTGDGEGEINSRPQSVDSRPAKQKVEAVLKRFTGEIEQVPPVFSAIKVNGQRAYKMARAGQDIKMEARTVKIYSLRSTYYKYPTLKITASVSSGTYIRSLAQDIGDALGTGAYLSALRRTQVGKFDLKNALKVEDLSLANIENSLQK